MNDNNSFSPYSSRRGDFEAFRLWEESGRGGRLFNFTVEPEPPFEPFSGTRLSFKPVDDARLPGVLRRLFSRPPQLSETLNSVSRDAITANPNKLDASPTATFRVFLPRDLNISAAQTEQLLVNLAYSATLVSLEVIALQDEIVFQITCRQMEADAVSSLLAAHLPQVEFRRGADLLADRFNTNRNNGIVSVDFGFRREWFLALPSVDCFPADSYLPLIAAFENLEAGELACFQVLFARTRNNWGQAAREAITDRSGKCKFPKFQDNFSKIKEKLSARLLAACVRFLASGNSPERARQITRRCGTFFRQFSSQSGNELIPLCADGLEPEKHRRSFLIRSTYRSGMLLTAGELAALVHLPSDEICSRKLQRDERKTKAVPKIATAGDLILGENTHAGQTTLVSLSREQRTRHLWVTGATGTGKSSLIINLTEQDMQKIGNGLMIIEPHGDLIDQVVARVPDNRINDVILFDPSDEEFPIGFNILSAHTEREKTLLASDLVGIFKKFSSSFGDVMHSVLANAVLAFLESTEGGTLLDLKRFLVDKSFRAAFLKTVQDEEIKRYWSYEFPQLAGRPYAPLLTRLDTFLRSKLIRNIVAQKENKLDFRRIMDERKILLLRLSHGEIGEDNAYLLGSLLLAKAYQAALSRQDMAENKRHLWTVISDEAHHFIVPSLSLLLSGARKYGISILLSHQELQQIASRDADVLASLYANAFTRICLRLGDMDPEKLAKGFSFFKSEHLKNLGIGESICRVERAEFDFNLKIFPPQIIPSETVEKKKATIIENTRLKYGKPKADVEAEYRSNQSDSGSREIIRLQPDPVFKNSEAYGSADAPKELQRQQTDTVLGKVQPDISQISIQSHRGRGSQHHQELQSVIRRMAESYGFQVEIEKSILEGRGSVDVSLEKERLKIACEVSVTSSTDYETKNVLKCLAADYDYAVVVVSNQKKLSALNAKLRSNIPFEKQEKIKAFSLTGLLAFLRELTASKDPAQKKSEKAAGQRLNFAEACEFFGVGASTLYRWIREGRVPFYRPGREYQFDRDELVLIGKQDLSGERKASVKLQPLKIGKATPKSKKEQNTRYRKMLKLD